jgi:hypothetical protein
VVAVTGLPRHRAVDEWSAVGIRGIPWASMVSKVFNRSRGVRGKEFTGFLKHLTMRLRFTPSGIWCIRVFVFRSCGQLCGPSIARAAAERPRAKRKSYLSRWCQTACKPGSVHLVKGWTAIPLGRTSRHVSRDQPGRRDRNVPAVCRGPKPATTTAVPIRSCSRWGLPCRPCCQGRGALLPHRFALARGARMPCAGGLFSVALSLGSPPPAVSRHRVPVEPGLSSALPQRPSGCLARLTPAPGQQRGQAQRVLRALAP